MSNPFAGLSASRTAARELDSYDALAKKFTQERPQEENQEEPHQQEQQQLQLEDIEQHREQQDCDSHEQTESNLQDEEKQPLEESERSRSSFVSQCDELNQETHIGQLDQSVIHRICSGQVVSNLGNAVKELLENAIDAGATYVEITFRNQGMDSFEVSDNGSGIRREHYEKVTQKSFTSKIKKYEDIEKVATFGFRGEALSALCELCPTGGVQICTRTADELMGTKMSYSRQGKIISSVPTARPVGTTVYVSGLFETLPVRRREFVRTIKTQYPKALSILTSYAIISTGVRINCVQFDKKNNKKVLFRTPGSDQIKDNITSIFGSVIAENLEKAEISLLGAGKFKLQDDDDDPEDAKTKEKIRNVFQDDARSSTQGSGSSTSVTEENKNEFTNLPEFKLEGYVSKFGAGIGMSSSGDRQYWFVNGRPIDFSKGSKVINGVWRQREMKQKPAFFLNIIAAPGTFDVNVTPDKRSVFLVHERILLADLKTKFEELWQRPDVARSLQQPKISEVWKGREKKMSQKEATLSQSLEKEEEEPRENQQQDDEGEQEFEGEEKDESRYTVTTFSIDQGIAKQRQTRNKKLEENKKPESPVHEQKRQRKGKNGIDLDLDTQQSTTTRELFEDTPPIVASQEDRRSSRKRNAIDVEQNSRGGHEDNEDEEEEEKRSPQKRVKHLVEELEDVGPSFAKADDFQEGEEEEEEDEGELEDLGSSFVKVKGLQEKEEEEEKRSPLKRAKLHLVEELDDDLGTDFVKPEGFQKKGFIQEEATMRQRQPIPDDFGMMASQQSTIGQPASYLLMKETGEEDAKRMFKWYLDRKKRLEAEGKRRRKEEAEEFSQNLTHTVEALGGCESSTETKFRQEDFGDTTVLGQFNKGFIVGRLKNDLFIFDQHACDEKYLFETLQKTTKIRQQNLIRPYPVQISAADAQVVLDNLDIFEKCGFKFLNKECEDVSTIPKHGKQQLLLTTIPHSMNTQFGAEDVCDLAALLREHPPPPKETREVLGYVPPRPPRTRAMFASRACRKAIMIGDVLTHKQMKQELERMTGLEQPWNCPHGRPTMRHLTNLDRLNNGNNEVDDLYMN